MSGFVVQGPLVGTVLPAFERRTSIGIVAQWAPTSKLMEAVARGDRADVAILTDEAVRTLIARGILIGESRTPLVRSLIGLAVRRGDPKPDIATPEALVRTLVGARSVAYSKGGASGIYFEKLIERLGIADAVLSRATVIADGLTSECLVSGRADVAVQQVSELMSVEAVDVIGPLPAALQPDAVFTAAIFAEAPNPAGAYTLLSDLQSNVAREAYRTWGLFDV